MCVLRWLEHIFVMDVWTFMHRVGVHMRVRFYMAACGSLLYSHDGPREGINHQLSRAAGDCAFCRKKRGGEEKIISYSSHLLHFPLALSLSVHATVTEKQETRLILLLKDIKHTPCPPPPQSSPSPTVTERKQTDLFDRMVQSRCPPYVSVVF